ncbi:hypothetical protein XFF4834R_chr32780 [Xanthomonas citri pv. fuscans]|nr:hypothetical protein XFF4834R_chr32780 [Xanthomonas citri pv. fuscans]
MGARQRMRCARRAHGASGSRNCRKSCIALRCDNMSHKLARIYCVGSLPMGYVQVQQRLRLTG